MFKIFGNGIKHTKDSTRCLVIDIRHPIKIKSAVAEPSINKSEFLDVIKNKTKKIPGGAKTIFTRFISTRSAMIVFALVLALGGFFIAFAQTRQLDAFIIRDASTKENTGSNSQNIYAQILGLFSSINETPGLILSFREFNKATTSVTEVVEELRTEWFSLIWSDGKELISKLEKARDEIKATANLLTNIKDGMTSLEITAGVSENLFALQSRMQKEADSLSKAIDLVKGESVIAVFFVNNLEIKTKDNFIKSYATVKLTDGEVKDILVSDIPYLDQFINTKIISQTPFVDGSANEEVENTSQFFNFLASAPKMLGFLEALPAYANQKIKLDGAIAVNYEVIADILSITGPIKLSEHNITFDQDNFLTEIQKELSKEPMLYGAERKNVLTLFIVEIISKIQKMPEQEMRELTSIINYRLNNQDIQFYFVE